jgi:hypothetical protein
MDVKLTLFLNYFNNILKMLYIIKYFVKCIYCLQKYNNHQILCYENKDPKKNNDIESCDDNDSQENENMIDIERLAFYNFLYIISCEMYKYLYIIAIIVTYIFIFYVMIELYSL